MWFSVKSANGSVRLPMAHLSVGQPAAACNIVVYSLFVTLLKIKNHSHKNTSADHMDAFYKTFDDIKDNKYDGMIFTGSPLEHMDFSDVFYWEEMQKIFDWAKENVTSSLFIC